MLSIFFLSSLPIPLFADSTLPFGGQILGSPIYCTCSIGHLVRVGPPRAGIYHYIPGKTTLYQFNNVYSSGTWLLGNYTPGTGTQCRIHTGHHCHTIPNDGVMSIVGTSS